jgi:hypothetical protein
MRSIMLLNAGFYQTKWKRSGKEHAFFFLPQLTAGSVGKQDLVIFYALGDRS